MQKVTDLKFSVVNKYNSIYENLYSQRSYVLDLFS